MTILSNIIDSGEVDYFKELPFYNKHIEKQKIKCLKNIDLLAELPFFEQLNLQLEAIKSSVKDLFSDLLNETKGFKYQVTVKIFLKKYTPNGEIEFAPVYFNSLTKTIINKRFKLENPFQEILYRIDC